MSSDSTLPEGWRMVRFGEVVRQVKKKVDPIGAGLERYVAGEHMDTDDLTIRRWGNVGEGYLGPAFTAHFVPGQVLYGSRRTYLRKVAVADFEGVCANTTFVLEPSSSDLLPDFLPYVMTTERFHEHSIRQSKGSVNPYINYRDLTWYEFALPPLQVQESIVHELSVIANLGAQLRKAQQAAAELRESIFSNPPKQNVEIQLGNLLHSCDYGLSVVPEAVGDVPILRMNNLEAGELNFEDLRWVPASAALDAYFVRSGDVLFNRTNSLEHVGKVALVGDLPNPMVFASYLLRLRVKEDEILPEYVAGFLQSKVGRGRISAFITLGVSQANVNATNLKKVCIPIPTLEDQHELVDIWRAIRSAQNAVAAHIASTRELMSTMRHQLLEVSDVH
jgi:type I restriction enzyme, S subunit